MDNFVTDVLTAVAKLEQSGEARVERICQHLCTKLRRYVSVEQVSLTLHHAEAKGLVKATAVGMRKRKLYNVTDEGKMVHPSVMLAPFFG